MFWQKRTYQVFEVDSPESLAEKLTEHTWCGCQAFKCEDVLFVNDSSSGDGASEWAVIRDGRAVESITFGWCSYYRALQYICELIDRRIGGDYGPGNVNTDHGRSCYLCA